MMTETLDTRIAAWRTAVLRSRAVTETDADELEGHLRDQVADLETAGLSDEEAFLIAVKRLGQVDAVTAEYAREHGDRLWKQLVAPGPETDRRRSIGVMIGFAVAAALLIHVGRLLASTPAGDSELFGGGTGSWFFPNLGFFVLPVLAAYLGYTARVGRARGFVIAGILVVLALVINLYPLEPGGDTQTLVGIHLPILLWLVAGAASLVDLRSSAARMDFIRFTGEWAIYYVLIALGGGVLMALTGLVLTPVIPTAIDDVFIWVVPAGAAGAVIVAAWLVDAKKSIIENLAPVLTAIFTPLFAVMLIVAAVGYAVVGLGSDFDRDLLTGFDVLLLVVVGLVVYGISARAPEAPRGVMDILRFVAVVAAIVLDLLVLVAMLSRVGEFGFTPNRVAALGLNLVLLVNLLGTAWFAGRQLFAGAPAAHVERWQTGYLPVFAGWLLVVVLVLPAVFAFA